MKDVITRYSRVKSMERARSQWHQPRCSGIRLFVTVGKGTLAPWEPTQKLVVQRVYSHVRNPMISGVLFSLLGEWSSRLPCRFSGGSSSSHSSTPSISRSWKSLGSSNDLAKITWTTSRTCRDGFRDGRRGTVGREHRLEYLVNANTFKLTMSDHYNSIISNERQAGGQTMTPGC